MNQTKSTSFDLMNSTLSRLETFSKCRLQQAVSTSDWAQCGFTYNTCTQAVECASCKTQITDWYTLTSANLIQQYHKTGCVFADSRASCLTENELIDSFQSFAVNENLAASSGVSIDLGSQLSSKQCSTSGDMEIDIETLRRENTRLKALMMCRQCKGSSVETLFLPCRHLVSCETCAVRVDDCFVCNAKILGTVRTFFND